MTFMQRMALVGARDYLMWLVELQGVRQGAVESVRTLIDKALAEDDSRGEAARNGWVAIEDRLPQYAEPTARVLTFTESGFVGCEYVHNLHRMNHSGDFYTHWKPLPEGPFRSTSPREGST